MRRDRRTRTGSTLLEVIVALALLGTVGIAAVSLAVDVGERLRHTQRADASMSDASAFMDAVALWTRDDFDRHLGERRQGRWRMRVVRPAPTLYDIELRDSASTVILLQTSVYRDADALLPRQDAPR